MAFLIGFSSDNEVSSEDNEKCLEGNIVVGSFEENFLASLSYWKRSDYLRHWKSALIRIVSGAKDSCLITSMYDPSLANFIIWWPLYRIGDTIAVQNQVLFLDRLADGFDEQDPFKCIGPRRVTNERGDKLSEWTVGAEELESFVRSLHG